MCIFSIAKGNTCALRNYFLGISDRRVTAILMRLHEIVKAKPRTSKLSNGSYVASITPLFIYSSWAYNTTAECTDNDYLGTAETNTKNREQQRQRFAEMSNKGSL